MIGFHLRQLPFHGTAAKTGVWYVGVEFHRHPPHRYSCGFLFLPYVFAYCVKWERFEQPHWDAPPEKKRGGFVYWTSPIGFNLTLERR